MRKIKVLEYRGKCYQCNRPQSSCMCKYVNPISTQTQFIILMHPKEHNKTKNGTGYLTHLSLPNSKVCRGIDFSNDAEINAIINNHNNQCYILYPGNNSIILNHKQIETKQKNLVIFIIDSTWACSKKILRLSKNLQDIKRVSFENTKLSAFKIKEQPKDYCLSTIESTLTVLELLNSQKIESIEKESFSKFLNPFERMVEYQLEHCRKNNIRIK